MIWFRRRKDKSGVLAFNNLEEVVELLMKENGLERFYPEADPGDV
jgi:hypothetical protein